MSRLGPNVVGKIKTDENLIGLSLAKDNQSERLTIGGKRPIQDLETLETKRQKIDDCSGPKCPDVFKSVTNFTGIGDKEYGDFMCSSLNMILRFLEPPGDSTSSFSTETSLTAICALCIVFCEHPHAELSLRIFRQMFKWISWMFQQVCVFVKIFL